MNKTLLADRAYKLGVTVFMGAAAAAAVGLDCARSENRDVANENDFGKPRPGVAVSAPPSSDDASALLELLVARKDRSHIDGLSPSFRRQLRTMFAAMPLEIRANTRIVSGYRSVERQRQLYAAALAKYRSPAAARRWVAPPGRSQHNFGLAVDLSYGSKAALEWVHMNVVSFGLHFPMKHENWHVEPLASRRAASENRNR